MGDGGGSGFSWVRTWSWWRVLSFPMNPPRPLSETTISRRSALGLLLAAGLWPGCVRVPSTQRPAGAPFTFAALNDLHHAQPECDPWFEAVFGAEFGARMRAALSRKSAASVSIVEMICGNAALPEPGPAPLWRAAAAMGTPAPTPALSRRTSLRHPIPRSRRLSS